MKNSEREPGESDITKMAPSEMVKKFGEQLPVRGKTFSEWQKEIMEWAEEKGWNQGLDVRSFGDWISLMHTEVSEAYEDYRNHHGIDEIYYEYEDKPIRPEDLDWFREQYREAILKPCGIPIEMADLMIRILHFAEFFKFDVDEVMESMEDEIFLSTQDNFGDWIAKIHSYISQIHNGWNESARVTKRTVYLVAKVKQFCYTHGIAIGAMIAMKMDYNRKRSYRHGGKKV